MQKLLFTFRKTRIGNSLSSFTRYVFRKPVKTNFNKNSKGLLNNPFSRFKKVSFVKIILVLLASGSILFLLITFHKQNTFSLQSYSSYLGNPKQIDRESFNVSVSFYQEQVDSSGVLYRHIVSSSVINLRTDGARILNIHPSYIVSSGENRVPIRSFLNEVSNNTDRAEYLRNSLESLLGIKIDRYIAIDIDEFEKLSAFLGASFSRYDFDTLDEFDDSVLSKQNKALAEFSKSGLSTFNILKILWSPGKAIESIKTDMNKSEFNLFVLRLRKGIRQSIIIGSDISQEARYSVRLNGISSLIDEKIRATYANFSILSEQAEIEVYNASGIGGLAGKYTRLFQNNGATVVKSSNYVKPESTNLLFVDSEQDLITFQNTINMIKHSLDNELLIEVGTYRYNKSGHIIVVLGS